jgi:hypothetical protein
VWFRSFLFNTIIESVTYPIPHDAKYLAEKTINDFLLSSDLSTADKRMKQVRTPEDFEQKFSSYRFSSRFTVKCRGYFDLDCHLVVV